MYHFLLEMNWWNMGTTWKKPSAVKLKARTTPFASLSKSFLQLVYVLKVKHHYFPLSSCTGSIAAFKNSCGENPDVEHDGGSSGS